MLQSVDDGPAQHQLGSEGGGTSMMMTTCNHTHANLFLCAGLPSFQAMVEECHVLQLVMFLNVTTALVGWLASAHAFDLCGVSWQCVQWVCLLWGAGQGDEGR